MKARKLIVAGSLVVPALLLTIASCNDIDQNPVDPSRPDALSPSPRQIPKYDPSKAKLPPESATELALALTEDASPEAQEAAITTSRDLAPHDPTVAGMRVICLDGEEVYGPDYEGEATRFRNNKGCELNTIDRDQEPGEPSLNDRALVRTAQNRIKGKLLTTVQQLDFYFAGSDVNVFPPGGSTHLVVPIDECEPVVSPATGGGVTNCPPGQKTDGMTDFTVEMYIFTCTDGDPYVGALRGEDDPTCTVYESAGAPHFEHANWTEFETQHPGARIARDRDPFIEAWFGQAHYLIYRVNLR